MKSNMLPIITADAMAFDVEYFAVCASVEMNFTLRVIVPYR